MKLRVEGYIRPIVMQVQWCLSLLGVFNTFILVFGRPAWYMYIYYIFPPVAIAWVVYYFKRGRSAELGNASRDNPVIKEMVEALDRIESKIDDR